MSEFGSFSLLIGYAQRAFFDIFIKASLSEFFPLLIQLAELYSPWRAIDIVAARPRPTFPSAAITVLSQGAGGVFAPVGAPAAVGGAGAFSGAEVVRAARQTWRETSNFPPAQESYLRLIYLFCKACWPRRTDRPRPGRTRKVCGRRRSS